MHRKELNHMYLVSLLMLVIRISSGINTMCSDVDLFPHLEEDSRLLNVHFFNVTTGSLLTCVRECQFRQRCASFNFDVNSGLCILNERSRNETHESNFINLQGFVFSDIMFWPETVSGACADHNCSNTHVCSPVSEADFECVLVHCINPPLEEHGVMVGISFSFG